MFLSAHELTNPELTAEVVVFGAGAAGITIASELGAKGIDVLLIEGGGFDITDTAQALFDATAIGTPMRADEGRYRVFGGTTVAWTGRCAPLDPIDFEQRPWVPDSGWPISWQTVADYYPRAAALVGIGDRWHDPAPDLSTLPGRPATVEPFAWRLFSDSRGTFRHFGEMVYSTFSAAARPRVLLEADLVGLVEGSRPGSVGQARLRRHDGAFVTVRAPTFIMCCGGIENARLLLNFADDVPSLFHAVAPAIGRYFMQHPRAPTAHITASSRQALVLQRRFNLFRRPGLHHETGFAISERAQREQHLLNASAVLRYDRPATGGVQWIRPDRAAAAAVRALRGWEPQLSSATISLHVDVEQVPDRDSRILLNDARDAIGLRTAAVDWRINTLDRRTAAVLTEGVCEWIEASGLGSASTPANLAETGGLTDDVLLESYHHLGATRMSSSPETGVVDRDLKVHGIDNLYVCGGSVMPTGGHANPTLTILALALRLADEVGHAKSKTKQ